MHLLCFFWIRKFSSEDLEFGASKFKERGKKSFNFSLCLMRTEQSKTMMMRHSTAQHDSSILRGLVGGWRWRLLRLSHSSSRHTMEMNEYSPLKFDGNEFQVSLSVRSIIFLQLRIGFCDFSFFLLLFVMI